MTLGSDVKAAIRKYAIKNAMDYGKASEGAVMSKVISLFPGSKSDMGLLRSEVKSEVDKVNSMARNAIEEEYSAYSDEFKTAEATKAQKSALHRFSIPGAEHGKFVTRFPPEPGGYLHIGHAKPIFIEDELRKAYSGKLLLYFDDTNPDNERQEFVDSIKEDLAWLGLKFDSEYYASDAIPSLYQYASSVIGKGMAYVCTCSTSEVKKRRDSGIPCAHKSQDNDTNLNLWEKMLTLGFGDNEAIVRFNSDLGSVNTTMRDPTLFRIKHSIHYRQGKKYHVWPTYDFCTPIMDSTNGITDVVRSKEYEMRDELYFAVLDALGLRKPRITSFSRLEISNNATSKRKIRELIASKKIAGYDDPRLVTIRALKRRGILPTAIREFALSFGMGKSESVVDTSVLLNINRKMADKDAKRLFFIESPAEMHVKGLEGVKGISMRLHPSTDLGKRTYYAKSDVLIGSEDAKGLKPGDVVRLKEAYNVRIDALSGPITASYGGSENIEAKKINWINKDGSVKCCLWDIGPLLSGDSFNEGSITEKCGVAEGYASNLNEGDIVQFEKYGFYKLDSKAEMRFLSL